MSPKKHVEPFKDHLQDNYSPIAKNLDYEEHYNLVLYRKAFFTYCSLTATTTHGWEVGTSSSAAFMFAVSCKVLIYDL